MAQEKRDYYETLGVGRDAGEDEIKQAFKRLARQYHPDVNKADPEAEAKFKEINEAYEVLGDREKRARYDQFGHAGPGQGFGGFDPGAGFGGFGDLRDLFDMFMGAQRPRHGPEAGADLAYDLEMSLEEAYRGLKRTITVPRIETCETCRGSGAKPGTKPERCPRCQGTGQVRSVQSTFLGQVQTVRTCEQCGGAGVIIAERCPDCRGAGRVRHQRQVEVPIPPGVDEGTRLRIAGGGEAGRRGGPTGDLYVIIRLKPHPVFQRRGRDIIVSQPIGFVQAALGAEVEVPTLEGQATLRIPEGTQSGTRLRMRGKGMPDLEGRGRGDQHVQVMVVTPQGLNEAQRAALREFARLGGDQLSEADRTLFQRLRDVFGA